MSKLILVPVDGSDPAKKAIEFAADWAKHHDATLLLAGNRELGSLIDELINRLGVGACRQFPVGQGATPPKQCPLRIQSPGGIDHAGDRKSQLRTISVP